MEVEVVDPSGAHFQVGLEQRICTCGRVQCIHLRFAEDIASRRLNVRYELLSAFHKELRRSDTRRAIQHGMILEKLYGSKLLENYLRKIVFEETRSLALARSLDGSWQSGVRMFGMTRKKWESPPWTLIDKIRAYIASVDQPYPSTDPDHLFTRTDYYEALAEFFRIKRLDKGTGKKRRIAAALHGAWKFPKSYLAELVVRSGPKLAFYEWIASLWDLYGMAVPPMTTEEAPPIEPENYFLTPAPYAYDHHTRQGARLIRKFWREIRPGSPNPAGLDLRWSGGILATLWRERAVGQFGINGYRNQPWEAVQISSDDWRLAKTFDSYFYSDLYARLEPDVCLESTIDMAGMK